jgi:hypothetical protein
MVTAKLWDDRNTGAVHYICSKIIFMTVLAILVPQLLLMPVTVAVRSEALVLAGLLLGSWVRIPLKAWTFVRVFMCCVVLCRQRPCDRLITRPRSVCLNSSRNLLCEAAKVL